MPPILQRNRMLQIKTPLGQDELLLTGFRGEEGVSRLFGFDLEFSSQNHGISFEDIVGKNVTISVALAQAGKKRFFNGFVSRFTQVGAGSREAGDLHLAGYRATVVPWLWFLTLTENSKIFQDKSVPDIVEAVFRQRGFQDYALRLHGSYEKRVYCVQYRESDFRFVSRLLEDEGIFYFFEHEEGKHTLVLTDDPSEIKPCPQQPAARFAETSGERVDEDRVQEFQKRMEVKPTKVTLNDYNFEVPNGCLKVEVPNSRKLTDRDCEIYDYPGGYDKISAGERLGNIRMQEEEARGSVFTGTSNCRAFTSGQKFELKEYRRADMTDKEYCLVQIEHEAAQGAGLAGAGGQGEKYVNRFTCLSSDAPLRPRRSTPRPVVRGTQTAAVVGPSGEEIYTDEHGRIKVQFHWDRDGQKDDKSSCWIRVAQVWAGPGWGGVCIPRIGQEVIVDFLEGDPDRPIVIGAVYHGTNRPPYPLPDEKTRSTIRSESTLGGGGFNEFRFDDKKGSEEVFLHGQKDWTIRILNDKTETIGKDERLSVGGMKNETVGINSAETIGGGKELTIGGAYAVTVGAGMNTAVGGAMAEEVGGLKSVNVGKTMDENVSGRRTSSVGDNYSVDVQETSTLTSKKIVFEAQEEITLKSGSSTIRLKKDGTILIDGKNVSIQGSGTVNVKASGDVKIKGSKIGSN